MDRNKTIEDFKAAQEFTLYILDKPRIMKFILVFVLTFVASSSVAFASANDLPGNPASKVTNIPVICAPNMDAFNVSAVQPQGTTFWAQIAGVYNWTTKTITLSPNTCKNLALIPQGYSWQRGYAAFTLAHEIGHSTGIFNEDIADCYGANHVAEIAYAYGLRGHNAFAKLISDGKKYWGYNPIPISCFRG